MLVSLRKIRLGLVILALLPTAGCERVWNLLILKQYQPRLVFCLTNGSDVCSGDGVQMNAGIDIERVGPDGSATQRVWSIDGTGLNDNKIKQLEYGVLPIGWNTVSQAVPIETGQYYSFNNDFYFVRDATGDFHVMSRGRFWSTVWSRPWLPEGGKFRTEGHRPRSTAGGAI